MERTARNIAIIIIASTALLIAALATSRLLRGRHPHVDIDRERYPVAGIDLSAHNGRVDFDSVAEAGISFAYLKASEGVNFRDSEFRRNHAAAVQSGIAVGAYHFFRFDCDGRRQCNNFLQAIDSCRLDLPVAIDVEEWGNTADAATDVIVARLREMVGLLNAAGHDVLIYTNKNGYRRFVATNFDANGNDAGIWICSFTDPPMRATWTLWQHSHIGRVPGVKGSVDLNTFNGSTLQWEQWLEQRAAARDAQ